jgi:hypothetical protein
MPEGPSDAVAKMRAVTDASRSERTARMLGARLSELARALERADVPPAAASRLLEAASIATMHAVTLDLLTAQRARELWCDAAAEHPDVVELRRFAA